MFAFCVLHFSFFISFCIWHFIWHFSCFTFYYSPLTLHRSLFTPHASRFTTLMKLWKLTSWATIKYTPAGHSPPDSSSPFQVSSIEDASSRLAKTRDSWQVKQPSNGHKWKTYDHYKTTLWPFLCLLSISIKIVINRPWLLCPFELPLCSKSHRVNYLLTCYSKRLWKLFMFYQYL